jgi:hypothetical protein
MVTRARRPLRFPERRDTRKDRHKPIGLTIGGVKEASISGWANHVHKLSAVSRSTGFLLLVFASLPRVR